MCIDGQACAIALKGQSEDNLLALSPSFHCVWAGHWAQGIRIATSTFIRWVISELQKYYFNQEFGSIS